MIIPKPSYDEALLAYGRYERYGVADRLNHLYKIEMTSEKITEFCQITGSVSRQQNCKSRSWTSSH